MRRTRAVAALMAVLAHSPLLTASAYSFQGDGTSYSLGDPSGGNCNLMNYPSDATTKYAAINSDQWASSMNCGRCAQVTCTDSQCAGASQEYEVVYIVDQCPECVAGDLDLSPEVFESITGLSYTRVSIEWSFVDCPVQGNIEYCLKTGSNSFWTAVQPTNVVSGVKSLTINRKATTMVDSAYYFLLDGKSQEQTDLSQVTIAMVGVNGEEVQDTVSFASESCVEGSSQFSTGNAETEEDYSLTSNALRTTPTIIGLGVLVLIAVALLIVVAINARRKKLALLSKQEDAEDRLPTMMSPRSPSSSYIPVQTPPHSFAVLY